MMFLAIVGVSLMISMKGGVGGRLSRGSLTNLRTIPPTITDTITVTDTCPPCDYPTSHYGYHHDKCRQVCHSTKEEQTNALNSLPYDYPETCTGTFIKIGRKGACVFDFNADSF